MTNDETIETIKKELNGLRTELTSLQKDPSPASWQAVFDRTARMVEMLGPVAKPFTAQAPNLRQGPIEEPVAPKGLFAPEETPPAKFVTSAKHVPVKHVAHKK